LDIRREGFPRYGKEANTVTFSTKYVTTGNDGNDDEDGSGDDDSKRDDDGKRKRDDDGKQRSDSMKPGFH
jgi:hypothetical protein